MSTARRFLKERVAWPLLDLRDFALRRDPTVLPGREVPKPRRRPARLAAPAALVLAALAVAAFVGGTNDDQAVATTGSLVTLRPPDRGAVAGVRESSADRSERRVERPKRRKHRRKRVPRHRRSHGSLPVKTPAPSRARSAPAKSPEPAPAPSTPASARPSAPSAPPPRPSNPGPAPAPSAPSPAPQPSPGVEFDDSG